MRRRFPWAAFMVLFSACGGGLPRNVRESFHHSHPECRGRDISGEKIGDNSYRVEGCGYHGVYICPTGSHSKWKRCWRSEDE